MPDHASVRIREAAFDDLELLFAARRHMFADMGVSISTDDLETIEDALRAFVRENRHAGPIGFIAEDDAGELVGAVSISHEVTQPTLHDLTGRQAYLYGMWVRPASRRRGVARSLVSTAVAAARAAGAGSVSLVASDEGRKLYESLGFSAFPAMRLSFAPLHDFRDEDFSAS
jgi:ribosomal protein S18 acetylase RimI-like enzyme